MKRATLPPDQFSPREIEVDIKVPSLWRMKWRWHFGRFFGRRVPQADECGAPMAVSLTVQWPDGKLTNHIERISGKSSAPYIRSVTLVRVDDGVAEDWKQLAESIRKIAQSEIERQKRYGGSLFVPNLEI